MTTIDVRTLAPRHVVDLLDDGTWRDVFARD